MKTASHLKLGVTETLIPGLCGTGGGVTQLLVGPRKDASVGAYFRPFILFPTPGSAA